ncbi:MAG TPA: hypothetical protein VMC10_19985 [Stellaceae bacterium]|nr:hypothetical protein [Stellaceae bacterium]
MGLQEIAVDHALTVAAQEQNWRDFYEQAWAARATFMRALIADGETNPYRIIKLLERQERQFRIIKGAEGVTWEKLPWPKELSQTPAGTPAFRIASFRGENLVVPFYASDNLHKFIVDYIAETGPYDGIVELGCGYGRNLFEIFFNGGPREVPYFGGELTASGVAIASELAALEPRLRASFFRFDHLKPDIRALPKMKRALLFTMHSLEQVKFIPPDFFLAISRAAAEVACLHFEPFGYQVANLGPASEAHHQFAVEMGWNQNFAASLAEATQRFGLKTSFIATELFLPLAADNPTSLAIWHSSAKP